MNTELAVSFFSKAALSILLPITFAAALAGWLTILTTRWWYKWLRPVSGGKNWLAVRFDHPWMQWDLLYLFGKRCHFFHQGESTTRLLRSYRQIKQKVRKSGKIVGVWVDSSFANGLWQENTLSNEWLGQSEEFWTSTRKRIEIPNFRLTKRLLLPMEIHPRLKCGPFCFRVQLKTDGQIEHVLVRP